MPGAAGAGLPALGALLDAGNGVTLNQVASSDGQSVVVPTMTSLPSGQVDI